MKDLTFNISETSQITGLSIDTLRYYDKICLIQSKKNPNNRYRYYTIADISIINHIKTLRDLDLSINDIKSLLHSDIEVQQTILKHHHKVLLEKIASIKKIEKVFKDTLQEAERLQPGWVQLFVMVCKEICFNQALSRRYQSILKRKEVCIKEWELKINNDGRLVN